MTAPMVSMQCPSQEALAAFVDGRLSPEEHAEVISHLALCADCRDLVLLAIDFQKSEGGAMVNENVVPSAMGTSVPPPNVVPFGKRILGYAAALAVAAAVVFAFLQYNRPGIDDLVVASAKEERRAFDGRLRGGFGYGVPPERLRGGEEKDPGGDNYDVTTLAVKMAEDRNLHRRGIGLLFLAKEFPDDSATYRDQGIDALTLALKQKPDDPLLMNDLAVALLDRGAKDDYEQAIEFATEAWSREPIPETAWNRALALELSRNEAAALQAWKDYVKLDPNSEWTEEARKRIGDIEDSLQPLQMNP